MSLCTGWHQKQRRRHAMAHTRAIEPKRIRNASAIVMPNPSKLADCLCQTVRQCCLELGLGTISTSAMCQNCSCVRMGFHGLPRGFPKGFPRGFHGVSGGFLPEFTLGLFTMNYVFCWVLLVQERQDWGFQTHPSVPIIKLEGCNPRERVSLWGGAGVKCRLPFSSRILTACARRLANPGESDDHMNI